jgi:AraC-like DNA-binding protein
MDGSATGWYFSTMPRQVASLEPKRVAFLRTKYGRELLLDAGYVSGYRDFDQAGRPHALGFHDILLVTEGRGRFDLDDRTHAVAPGVVLFTRPGEVRRWRVAHVDGACVFFTEDFVGEAFSDPRFLDQFAYFRSDRPSGALRLSPRHCRQYLERFDAMRREIAALRADASHALRAVLYELLVMLNRLYVAAYGAPARSVPNATLERFQARVERDFRRRHRLADYASELGVSPGHLNTLCRTRLRRSAGAWIRARITLEAKRLLLYSDATAAQIAARLGFEDPSYFARFFRREAGESATRFRLARRG